MKKIISLIFILTGIFAPVVVFSQEVVSLAGKPGTFEVLSRTDYAGADCGFTAADVKANLLRIQALVTEMRKNSVLRDIRGFMGRARIYSVLCKPRTSYGVPARISFEFSTYFRNKKGEVVYNTIEPPCWSVFINQVYPWDAGFSSNTFDSEKCYFTRPFKKRTIEPGIDIYDEVCIVIYDPKKPDYWIPVTVEEAFDCARESMNKEKDPVAAAYLKQFFDSEYSQIEPGDLKKPAYYGGGVSRVSATPGYMEQDSIFPPIMKINPAYWNKGLPKSAIQFITFQASLNKVYLENEYKDCLKHLGSNSGCDLDRFLASLDIEDIKRLAALIGK